MIARHISAMTGSATSKVRGSKPKGQWWRDERRIYAGCALLLLLVALVRIVATYRVLSQAYDEPADVVTGMEWLQKGTYTINLEHPPLSPVATAIGPFLAGSRLQDIQVMKAPNGVAFFDLTTSGNTILNAGGKYWHTLALARMGVLPFFVLGVLVVFVWARALGGGLAALVATLLLTTLPSVLAFSGLAYTDLEVAALMVAAVCLFAYWLERPRFSNALLLGATCALAVLANFPALLFLPACFAATLLCWFLFRMKGRVTWKTLLQQAACALIIFSLVLWAGYRFSIVPLNALFEKPAEDVTSLHQPALVKRVLYDLVALNPLVPAPAFLKGVALAFLDTGQGRPATYLLGHVGHGGWWYFYLVGLSVKTPIPFLMLALAGSWAVLSAARKERRWMLPLPLACTVAVLIVMMPVKVDRGIRHVLSVYFLLAIVAGYGAARLWSIGGAWRRPATRAALLGLLAWQVIVSFRSHPDYVAYFNEFAGRHPENFLLWGCDYDCGQDAARLGRLLQHRHISDVALRVYSSADFSKLGFPPFHILQPYEKKEGWIAASVSTIHTGDTHWMWPGAGNQPTVWSGNHRDAFSWLTACEPIAQAGRTIFLYYLPCTPKK